MNLSRIGGRSILNAAFCIKKGEKTAFIRVLNKVGRKKNVVLDAHRRERVKIFPSFLELISSPLKPLPCIVAQLFDPKLHPQGRSCTQYCFHLRK